MTTEATMTLDIRPEPTDTQLICIDCGASFTFTSGERKWFEAKRLSNPKLSDPKRCKSCRAAKRTRRAGGDEEGRMI
jgi:hypothetical protein